MLFNSFEFALFLPIVFVLYWFVFNKSLRFQNLLIVVASFVFYGWWDWRFLSLLTLSSLVDYLVGLGFLKLSKTGERKILLAISIIVNLGLLGFFKYYNFFIESFVDAFTFFGTAPHIETMRIVLPVGISFYTFQTMSYSIDVYRKNLEPTKDMIAFFAYVSFFPQLVAGPIERATNLLPQFYRKRIFEYPKAMDGMRQILWGLFKKIVIADNCAQYANDIFNNYENYNGSTLLLGAIYFAFQIYGDFSGYSDIAIGTSRLFGFSLMRNFAFPYFSRDMAEFWRRWHISLSTWFRDYVYIPLGGSKGTIKTIIRNTFLVFIISGFWHGANWTFIFWGFLNALYFMPLLLLKRNRLNTEIVAKDKLFPSIRDFINILFTFFLTTIAWIFFRSENITAAFRYLKGIFNRSIFSSPQVNPVTTNILLVAFILIEWLQRDKQHALELTSIRFAKPFRWGLYYLIIISIIVFGGSQHEFIYFQF
jgi:alginate O-acetyltransferase complex protein AlgI